MQRFPLWLLLVLMLSGCSSLGFSLPDWGGAVRTAPEASTTEVVTAANSKPVHAPEKHLLTRPNNTAKTVRNQNGKKNTAHIALLLPLKSNAFRAPADAVRQGFLAAAGIDSSLPVRVYSSNDESSEVASLYQQAISSGAQAVVGPLTRNGVSALIGSTNIAVPTLALNTVDNPASGLLYFFGMAVETEARQIAQQMHQDNISRVIVISSRSALAKRIQTAFSDEWLSLGNSKVKEIDVNEDSEVFAKLPASKNSAVFIAADAEKARAIRPYLPNKLAVYATSQLFMGNQNTLANYDLNQVLFVDMPWLLQVDHPAVMIYPRAIPSMPIDRERLYALGIDAFRLIQLLMDNKLRGQLPLDGVSGQISLNGHTFQRSASPAIFVQGKGQLLRGPVER